MPMTEAQKAYQKAYREKHKEGHRQYCRDYYQKNKEILIKKQIERDSEPQAKERRRQYERSMKRKKQSRKHHWKTYNLKYWGSLDDLHDRFENTNNCELCNFKFTGEQKNNYDRKVVEHDHISGYVRWICCQRCNIKHITKIDSLRKDVLLELHRYFNR